MTAPIVSEGARALQAWTKGKPADEALAREGAREVIAECLRLREILRVMAEGGLGDGAMFELLRPTRSAPIRAVICCGSQSEGDLMGAVHAALREVFARYGADLGPLTPTACGTTAMDADEAARYRADMTAMGAEEAAR